MAISTRYNTTFKLSDVELGVMLSVNVLFSTGGTIGNLLVCFAFVLHRNLRNTLNIFIFSLALADLLVCLIAQPMYMVSLVQNLPQDGHDTLSENVRKRLTWISMLASIGNLLGVTLDRYFIISNPLRYAARVTTNLAFVFVAIAWFIAIALGVPSQSYPNVKVTGQLYVAILLVGVTIPLYCRILCIARRHARLIHSTVSQIACNGDGAITLAQRTSSFNIQRADRNSLKTVGIISSIFVIGWFPLLVLPFLYRGGVYDRSDLLDALQWANTLALCSSACNPVVYTWRDRRFRKALTTSFARWRARRSIFVNDSAVCSDKFSQAKPTELIRAF